jgi:DNA-binding CsgD family transcriptional regulator/tetratricopeptide (TPR) repeat protein
LTRGACNGQNAAETEKRGAGGLWAGLYEREAELAALSQVLSAAREGAGGLVVVEGPAGIGKSRLLAEARATAAAQGMAVLTARGTDLERDAPFGVVSELFAAILAAPRGAEGARLVSGQASLATPLFDPAVPLAEDPSALVRGLYWLTVDVACGPPDGEDPAGLLIEVDDAQWSDRPSLSYLAYLAARIDELPVALVVAVRSGEEAADQQTLDWLRGRPGHWVLKPRALSPEAVTRMVLARLPAAEPSFTQACAEVSGGNPFLARELLKTLLADGIVPSAESVSRVRSLLPDSVLHSVLVRLARLGEPAERLAQAVAVLGDRASLRQARLLAGLDAEPAEKAADALAGARILAPGEPLSFTHPLIATSVLADIPAFARSRAHRRAADLLAADGVPADGIAAHLLLTRPDGDQQTVATLRGAAAQALTRGDPGAAAHLLARALAEPPVQAERGHVLLELANAEIEHGDAGAAGRIDEALRLPGAPADRVRALAALGRLRFNLGEHEAAAAAMDQALTLLKPQDPALPPLLVSYLSATTFRSSLHPLAAGRLRPVIEAARGGQPPDDPGLLAHLVLRLAFAAEPAERIRALAVRATATDPLVDPASLGILTGMVIQALCCVDELAEAERICEAALAAARRRGSLLNFTMASYHRAIARYHRGELTDALADLDQTLISTREGWTAGDPWHASLRVHIHVERGDLAAARAALTMTAGAAPGSMELPIALFARARLALAEGQPGAALADAEAVGRLLAIGFDIDHPGFVPWRRTAALAALALGQASQARALAAELIERARWSGTPRALGLALRTQAATITYERRLPLLAEAAEVLDQSPSALERTHALVELGAAYRRAGQRSAAEPPLRRGLQLADRIGAMPLIQAARRELYALGLRPRRSAVTGPGSLTPTERRVAELASSGLTNRQTAEALFVTVKTVETHLVRAYSKLGISTRTELTRVIGAALR